MPYDYSPKQQEIKTMLKWAETHSDIIFKTQATQSTLIRLTLN